MAHGPTTHLADHPLIGDLSDPLVHGWYRRMVDPSLARHLVVATPATPGRRVLEAFLDWRGGRLDRALDTVTQALAGPLEDWWRLRALGVQAVVLGEIGLTRESLSVLLGLLEEARGVGDRVVEAATLHDIAALGLNKDPERTLARFLKVMAILREIEGTSLARHPDVPCLHALTIVNVRVLARESRLDLAEDTPTLEDAEELARPVWPELYASLRAERAIGALERADGEPDIATARSFLLGLPDPVKMVDVRNACTVARAAAYLRALDGDVEGAVAMVRHLLDRVPLQFTPELLHALVLVYRSAGRLEEALDAAQRRGDILYDVFREETKTSVRALEVWFDTRTAREQAQQSTDRAQRLERHVAELTVDRERLRDRTGRDDLTGLGNRRRLRTVVQGLDATGSHQVAVLDLDAFKEVNDEYGHAGGDEALKLVAAALAACTSTLDTCVRYGGDEFVVVRAASTPGLLAEDLAPMASVPAPDGVGEGPLSTSIGVAWTTDGFDAALARADALMYEAKHAGGGRICADPRP